MNNTVHIHEQLSESEQPQENRAEFVESVADGIHVDAGLTELVRTLNTQLGVKTFHCCSGLWQDHYDCDTLDFEFEYLSRNYPQYYTDSVTPGKPIDGHIYRPRPDTYVTTEAFLHDKNNGTVTVHPDFYSQLGTLRLEPEVMTHHDELRYNFNFSEGQSIRYVLTADSFAQCDEQVQTDIDELQETIYQLAGKNEPSSLSES